MPWYHGVAEREHELQNPTSTEKILLMGERMRLGPGMRVLDVASGRGGPALLLAERFGCELTCVERAPEFYEAAVERARAARLEGRIRFVLADAREYPLEPGSFDVALCLGASFVFDGLDGTLAALAPAVRPGGALAVGEPFWRRLPLPDDYPGRADPFTTLAATAERFAAAGLPLLSLITASEDDWDRYETLKWRSIEEWLAQHADDPEADALRREHLSSRDLYLRFERELLGWAILVARRPA